MGSSDCRYSSDICSLNHPHVVQHGAGNMLISAEQSHAGILVNTKQCRLSNLASIEQLLCHWHNQIICNEVMAADLGIMSIVVSLHTQLASMTIDGVCRGLGRAHKGVCPPDERALGRARGSMGWPRELALLPHYCFRVSTIACCSSIPHNR